MRVAVNVVPEVPVSWIFEKFFGLSINGSDDSIAESSSDDIIVLNLNPPVFMERWQLEYRTTRVAGVLRLPEDEFD